MTGLALIVCVCVCCVCFRALPLSWTTTFVIWAGGCLNGTWTTAENIVLAANATGRTRAEAWCTATTITTPNPNKAATYKVWNALEEAPR